MTFLVKSRTNIIMKIQIKLPILFFLKAKPLQHSVPHFVNEIHSSGEWGKSSCSFLKPENYEKVTINKSKKNSELLLWHLSYIYISLFSGYVYVDLMELVFTLPSPHRVEGGGVRGHVRQHYHTTI